jgi:hypothetical protein
VHKDFRRCDSGFSVVAYAGRCAFVFRGTGARPSDFIHQVIKVNNLAPFTALNFNGYASPAAAVGGGKLKVTLFYSDPADNRSFSVPFPTGTGSYQPIQFVLDDTDIVTLVKVKLKFGYKGASGKLSLDSLSMVAVNTPRTLPVPPPPAG